MKLILNRAQMFESIIYGSVNQARRRWQKKKWKNVGKSEHLIEQDIKKINFCIFYEALVDVAS